MPGRKAYQARRHVDELRSTLDPIYEDAGKTIRLVRDTETGDYGAILPSVPSLPGRVRATIGDIIQNLRSALDHLAYQFILHPAVDPGEPKTPIDKVQFPI